MLVPRQDLNCQHHYVVVGLCVCVCMFFELRLEVIVSFVNSFLLSSCPLVLADEVIKYFRNSVTPPKKTQPHPPFILY
jgi:hypothetical protein